MAKKAVKTDFVHCGAAVSTAQCKRDDCTTIYCSPPDKEIFAHPAARVNRRRGPAVYSARSAQGPAVSLPPPAEVWPRENSSTEAMGERFAKELAAVHGETVRCGSPAELRRRLAELAAKEHWTSLGAMERPGVREALGELPPSTVHWPDADWQPRQIAELSAGVIEAEVLLADTGSCLIACPTAQDRLLCYLPPACVVIARSDRLAEHLPAAWEGIAARAKDHALSGEFVIITGPSRTADIEKILILGVHGPKRLIVMLLG
jgi:L-lactate dehydrogenase complex protein LldG